MGKLHYVSEIGIKLQLAPVMSVAPLLLMRSLEKHTVPSLPRGAGSAFEGGTEG